MSSGPARAQIVVDLAAVRHNVRALAAHAATPTTGAARSGRPLTMARLAPAPASRMLPGEVIARATGGVRNRSRKDSWDIEARLRDRRERPADAAGGGGRFRSCSPRP